jgi:hypothetical protein
MSEFKATLALFPAKEKRSEKSPDHSGNIEILKSEIPSLIAYLQSAETEENYKGEPVVKLSTATWINEMRDGRKYLKGSVSQQLKRDEPTVISPVTNDDALPF